MARDGQNHLLYCFFTSVSNNGIVMVPSLVCFTLMGDN